MRRALIFFVVLLVLGALGAVGLLFWADSEIQRAPSAPGAPLVEVGVPKGASGRSLANTLAARGLLKDARLWHWCLYRRGGLVAKAGRHLLSASMTPSQLAAALEAPPLPDDVPFVMVEGWRLRDTDAALAAAGLIKPGTYVAAASEPGHFKAPFPLPAGSLEGYLYPETYHVVPGSVDLDALIQRQLDLFVERFYSPHAKQLEQGHRSLHEIVVMASLLEREEPEPNQRPLVAGILWKRIDHRVPLGVDATSRYELAQWNDRDAFLKRLRDPSDPWNSRVRVGLPPGPIGAPTLDSLRAALEPKSSDYWYYLHDGQRHLHPSRNAKEHEELRRRFNIY